MGRWARVLFLVVTLISLMYLFGTVIQTESVQSFLGKVDSNDTNIEEQEESAKHHTSDAGRCKPKTNIVFIKTFKTGSSTMTNILSRYAMKHNLTIHSHDTSHIRRSNLISEHIVYNRKALSDVMPSDVIYVTQLRHPLAQLVSWLNFRGHSSLADPLKMYKTMKHTIKYSLWNSWRQMCVPENINEKEFNSYLVQLREEFDLVTITEQFDLSLLLLRRKLCWDISDMFYIPLKKADYAQNQNIHLINISHSEYMNRKYEVLNPMAYTLYRYFNRTLNKLIANAGPELQEEFVFYQQLKQKLYSYCSRYIFYIVNDTASYLNHVNSTDVLYVPASKWGKAHIVNPVECAMMKLHRRTFQDISALKTFPKQKGIFIGRHEGKAKEKELRKMSRALHQPIHSIYGIPLPVLTQVHAYDLNENVMTHGQEIQKKDIKKEMLRHQAISRGIDRCVEENLGFRKQKHQ